MTTPMTTPASQPAPLTSAEIGAALIRTDSIPGAYELVHWAEEGLVFVASAPSFEAGTEGFVHVLKADDLSPLRQFRLDRRPFALTLDRAAGRLYVGNTMDGSLTVLDARQGDVLGMIQLGQKAGEKNYMQHTRMIRLDPARGLAFVTSPGNPQSLVWIIDTKELRLLHSVPAGLWTTGAAFDAQAGRLYVSGSGREEILVLSPDGARLGAISTGESAEDAPETSQHFFLNLVLDQPGQRLFASDSKTGALYAFDAASGDQLARVDIGLGALDVCYNPARAEIYVSWRGASHAEPMGTGGLAVIDAQSYAIKAQLDLPPHPNSLELSADGQLLFVTVKMPFNKQNPTWVEGKPDAVLRLDLAKLPL
ncbi:YncE family protein [Xinfangfangia sp. D13-10-4-6]|uniref:YncE family protein n=1 Tax=Pseudogemmobacter hezensis TaxID=2737662 RepID=UPI001556ED9B|nr:YncE family protein [Pseudogemmobacter hezensis]NPD14801.1 YncE family protein [Pseudogemmobacter hezensis]